MNELGFLGGLSALAYIALEDEYQPLDQTDLIGRVGLHLEVSCRGPVEARHVVPPGQDDRPRAPRTPIPLWLEVGPTLCVVSSSVF